MKTVVIGLQGFMPPVYRKKHVAVSVVDNVENLETKTQTPIFFLKL